LSTTLGVFLFILTIIVMVMIHESGHYLAARAFGMKIEEFFLGFGPRLVSWRRGETEYGVKAIMAGGYVKIAGMNPLQAAAESEASRTLAAAVSEGAPAPAVPEPEEHRMFRSRPAWQRAIVLAAGSATHFVLAALILTFSFAVLGVVGSPTTVLHSVAAASAARGGAPGPAQAAGLRPGDRIVAVDGTPVSSWDEIQKYIRARPGTTVAIEVRRDRRLLSFPVTPLQATDANNQRIGLIGVAPEMSVRHESLPVAAWSGVRGVGSLVVGSIGGLGAFLSPRGIGAVFSSVSHGRPASPADQPIGLVGGARLAAQAVQTGQTQALVEILTAFIVFLGVLNLAPLPPLDGGHLLMLAIEKVRGRPVDMRKVVPVAALVLSLLVTLSIAILYLGITNPIANPFPQ